MERVAFTISGHPVAWGRPRAHGRVIGFGKAARAIVTFFTDPKISKAQKHITEIGKRHMAGRLPYTGAVRMTIVAVYEPPKSWTKTLTAALHKGVVYHTQKPDLDNLYKLVGDGLNEIVYVDDCQIAELIARKRYGSPARTEVVITPLASPTQAESPSDRRRAKAQAEIASQSGSAATPRLL